jgi:hypothetical protein
MLLCAAPAAAQDFVVSNTDDAGTGSLRAAIDAANTNGSAVTDQVTFTTTGNIFLATPLPLVQTPTTITGPGPSALAIRGNSVTSRMWAVLIAAGGEVRIENLTIADSRAVTNSGAALAKDGAGLLVLDHVVLSGNFGFSGAFSVGPGPARIVNSTFTQNDADSSGSAIAGNGAAQLEIINSTIAGNNADDNGGGILWNSTSTLTVLSSTIAGNTANTDNTGAHSGGGIFNTGMGGTIQIANTLIAGNAVGTTSPVQNQCSGAFTSSGYNLRSSNDVACTGFTGTGDVVIPNPLIGTLGPNGGPTSTVPLLSTSPAINTGNPASPGGAFPACPAADQRGLSRGGGAGVCDIGAFEVQPTPPTPSGGGGTTTPINLKAGIKKCKKKFPKGPKRKKCIKRAKHRAQA